MIEDKREQSYVIVFRERRGSGRKAVVLARHVATRLSSLCDSSSEAEFVVTGGDRQSRIEVYGKLPVSSVEKVLDMINCSYSIENVRRGM